MCSLAARHNTLNFSNITLATVHRNSTKLPAASRKALVIKLSDCGSLFHSFVPRDLESHKTCKSDKSENGNYFSNAPIFHYFGWYIRKRKQRKVSITIEVCAWYINAYLGRDQIWFAHPRIRVVGFWATTRPKFPYRWFTNSSHSI